MGLRQQWARFSQRFSCLRNFQKLVSTFFKNKVKVNRIQMQSFCLHVTRKKPRKKCLLSDYWVEQTLGKSFRLLKSTKSTKVQEYSPILVVFTYIRYSYFIDHTEPKASILYVSYIYICVTHCIAEWIILSMANLSMQFFTRRLLDLHFNFPHCATLVLVLTRGTN